MLPVSRPLNTRKIRGMHWFKLFKILSIFLLSPVCAFAADAKKFRLNIRSNLFAFNSGYAAGLDFATGRFSFGGYYARAVGKRKFGLTNQSSSITEVGLRSDFYFSRQAMSSSFFLSAIGVRDEGTTFTEQEKTVDGSYCYLSTKTSGVLFATKMMFGYAWFSKIGLNANLTAGGAYLMPTPSYEVVVDSIGCSVSDNGSSLKKKRLAPAAEFSIGWAF